MDRIEKLLFKYVRHNHLGAVKAILQNKMADVNAANTWGATPLHIAAKFGFVDMAKLLIEHGANIGAHDIFGYYPLLTAIWNRQSAVARLIMESLITAK